jgi:hypothetical protein
MGVLLSCMVFLSWLTSKNKPIHYLTGGDGLLLLKNAKLMEEVK